MTEIPAENLVPIRDALSAEVDNLTALIGTTEPPPPPPAPSEVIEGDGNSLTQANGHVWTFSSFVDGDRGSIILRDGNQYASGVAHKLVLSAGVIWAQTRNGTWYRDNGSYWVAGGAGP